jgi:hypothetical protein
MIVFQIFVFTLLYHSYHEKEINLIDTKVFQTKIMDFCRNKPARNFCSKTHIDMSLKILKQKQQNHKQLKDKIDWTLKHLKSEISQMRFLKDFIVDRYF